MCVIAAKPKGVKMPQWEIIKQMWDRNSDGAGLMWLNENNKVEISKGYMKYEDFERQVKSMGDLTETPVVMHFRITTHGGTTPENTHPFPVSDNIEHLKALDVISNLGVAHNGIINSVPKESENSDTQVYIRDILTPLSLIAKHSFIDEFETLINTTIGYSKLSFLDTSGQITLFGVWSDHEDAEGVKFSNLHFKPAVVKPVTTTTTTRNYGYATNSYKFENDEYYVVSPYYSNSLYMIELGIEADDILQYFEDDKHSILMNHTQNTVIDATSLTAYRFDKITHADFEKAFSCESACDDVEEIKPKKDKVLKKGSHNVGGRKNKETKDVRLNADRTLLKHNTHKSLSVRPIKVGSKLTGYYYEDAKTTSLLRTYNITTTSNNWFFEPTHAEILYKQKDGKYVSIPELQLTSSLKWSIDKKVNLKNIVVFFDDDTYWRI